MSSGHMVWEKNSRMVKSNIGGAVLTVGVMRVMVFRIKSLNLNQSVKTINRKGMQS